MSLYQWFQEFPLSATLREQLKGAEKQVLALQQELLAAHQQIVGLEGEVRGLEQEIRDLKAHDITFDAETGTWLGSASALHYCAKCKAAGSLSPMTNCDHGWKCPVCSTYAPDPKRPERPIWIGRDQGAW
jgi:hypothetical protein